MKLNQNVKQKDYLSLRPVVNLFTEKYLFKNNIYFIYV